MKIDGNAIRPGMVISHKDRLLLATRIQHTQPGKGGAYLQVELKDVRDGTKLNERFRSSETVERVRLYDKAYQFLFADADHFTFMDTETYEQISLARHLVGDKGLLHPGRHDGDRPVLRGRAHRGLAAGDRHSDGRGHTGRGGRDRPPPRPTSRRPWTTALRVMVPPHIAAGTRVVINTEDSTYRERARD